MRDAESTDKNDKKILALIKFLDFNEEDYDRFTVSNYDENVYLIDEGKDMPSAFKNNEFRVCTEMEADGDHYESFMNFVDELGFQSFSPEAQDYILNNCTDCGLLDEAFEESTRFYAEDIAEEESESREVVCVDAREEDIKNVAVEITNRLLCECIDAGIVLPWDLVIGENITEEGEWIKGTGDLVERYCGHYDDATKCGYDDAADWFKTNYGAADFSKFVIDNNLTDWDAVCEYCKEMDGRGNLLNGWDGKEYEEEIDGETYYIYPDCDFRALQPKAALEKAEQPQAEQPQTEEEMSR